MMRLIAVGRQRDGPEATLFARYQARLRPALGVTEMPRRVVRRRRSSAAKPPRCWPRCRMRRLRWHSIAVARRRTARVWRALLERWLGSGRPVCFLIGGAEGLDASGDRAC